MVDIQIVPARAAHIRTIAARMRQADINEIAAASGRSPLVALAFSYRKSSAAWTALVDGRPEVMFGVGDINVLAGVGAPWLLGTDAVEANYVAFLRRSVDWRDQLLRRYPVLKNFVDDRNKVSKRWLRWLGFRFLDPVEFRGQTFRLFELRHGDVRIDDGSNHRIDALGSDGGSSTGAGHRVVGALHRAGSGHERHARGAEGEGCA